MKTVLKFGGSSVADASTIRRVLQIVLDRTERGPAIVVVSAMGGVTDTLLACGDEAAKGSESFRDTLAALEKRHLEAVMALLPIDRQSATLSLVKKLCNDLEDICNGVFLLGELSPARATGLWPSENSCPPGSSRPPSPRPPPARHG